MGYLHYTPEPMPVEQAQELIDAGHTRFDYLGGRVMKVDLSGNAFNPRLYDRDNGQGAAQAAIDSIEDGGA